VQQNMRFFETILSSFIPAQSEAKGREAGKRDQT
jgi:hypothetical protein